MSLSRPNSADEGDGRAQKERQRKAMIRRARLLVEAARRGNGQSSQPTLEKRFLQPGLRYLGIFQPSLGSIFQLPLIALDRASQVLQALERIARQSLPTGMRAGFATALNQSSSFPFVRCGNSTIAAMRSAFHRNPACRRNNPRPSFRADPDNRTTGASGAQAQTPTSAGCATPSSPGRGQ